LKREYIKIQNRDLKNVPKSRGSQNPKEGQIPRKAENPKEASNPEEGPKPKKGLNPEKGQRIPIGGKSGKYNR